MKPCGAWVCGAFWMGAFRGFCGCIFRPKKRANRDRNAGFGCPFCAPSQSVAGLSAQAGPRRLAIVSRMYCAQADTARVAFAVSGSACSPHCSSGMLNGATVSRKTWRQTRGLSAATVTYTPPDIRSMSTAEHLPAVPLLCSVRLGSPSTSAKVYHVRMVIFLFSSLRLIFFPCGRVW